MDQEKMKVARAKWFEERERTGRGWALQVPLVDASIAGVQLREAVAKEVASQILTFTLADVMLAFESGFEAGSIGPSLSPGRPMDVDGFD